MDVKRGGLRQSVALGLVASSSGLVACASDAASDVGVDARDDERAIGAAGSTSVSSGGAHGETPGGSTAGANASATEGDVTATSRAVTVTSGGVSSVVTGDTAGELGPPALGATTSDTATSRGSDVSSNGDATASDATWSDVTTGERSPDCPTSLTVPFPAFGPATCTTPGIGCEFPLTCSSGAHVLAVTCEGGLWVGPQGCEHPYDFCRPIAGTVGQEPTVYCENGEWHVETLYLHTSGSRGWCPPEAPAEGSDCYVAGGTGGGPDREPCGYPCPATPANWTVFHCDNPGGDGYAMSDLEGKWVSDGACN